MEFKELMRTLINEELEDITAYKIEIEVLGKDPRCGAEITKLFQDLADQKSGRLKMLHLISKRSVSSRQYKKETVRSIEASLRTHAARAERNALLYKKLIEELHNPEHKEAVTVIVAQDLHSLDALRALQARIKQPQ